MHIRDVRNRFARLRFFPLIQKHVVSNCHQPGTTIGDLRITGQMLPCPGSGLLEHVFGVLLMPAELRKSPQRLTMRSNNSAITRRAGLQRCRSSASRPHAPVQFVNPSVHQTEISGKVFEKNF